MHEARADLSNTTVARFRVVSLLGRGGMGEVYRATDTALGRDVALKVLPPALTRDPERVARFVQEARSASALNHPHVVAIYDIGEADGIHYIAMELVTGQTLRAALDAGIDLPAAVEYLAQVADALSAAHAVGVIHRDLKPENVMVADGGYAKVLDFGLAKLRDNAPAGADEAETRAALTGAGMLVGTAGYMSPEQAQGRLVDHRTDIFSFGCILYETIARRRAFSGPSVVETLHRIIHTDPDPLPAGTPGTLRAVVRRCLAKDPAARYASMREVADDLRRARRELDPAAGSAAPRRRGLVAAAAVLALLAAGAIAWFVLPRRLEPARPELSVQQLTARGNVTDAAISPDGRYLAWVEATGGTRSLWVRQIGGSKDIEIIPAASVAYVGIAFSPDGTSIYYSMRHDEHPAGRLYSIDMLGGSPRPILDRLEGSVTFSPDGKQIAFFRRAFPQPDRVALMIAGIDGANERVLATRAAPETFLTFFSAPAWSPDGSRIVAPVRNVNTAEARLVLFDAATGADEPMPAVHGDAGFTAWLPDGSGILFAGRERKAIVGVFNNQIWLQPYPRGEPRRLTQDHLDYRTAWITRDGRQFVAVGEAITGGLWRLPLDGAAPQRIRSERFDGRLGVAALPDGRLVINAAGPPGQERIEILSADGANRQIVADSGTSLWPATSPDGRTIVFLSSRDGQPGIWRINADGTGARLLAPMRSASWLSVTPDGRHVVVTAPHEGSTAAWTIPIDGGEPALVAPFFDRASPSPDGRLLAGFHRPAPDVPSSLAVVPLDGSTAPRALAAVTPASGFGILEWTKAGDGIVYSSVERTNLFLQPLDGGKAAQLTNLTDLGLTLGDLSPDGRSVIVSRGLQQRDAYLFSNFR